MEAGQADRATQAGEARSFVAIACDPAVVRRALGYGVVVGAILIAINHGDALLRGDLGPARLLKMTLTPLVPYAVSTLSSVGALREVERERAASAGEAAAGEAKPDA